MSIVQKKCPRRWLGCVPPFLRTGVTLRPLLSDSTGDDQQSGGLDFETMEIALVIAVMALLSATAGLAYPFSPFGRRRNAALALIACFVVIGLVALEPAGSQLAASVSTASDKQPN